MKLHEISLKKSLNKAYRLIKPKRPDIDQLIEKGINQLKKLSQHYSEISLERKTRLLGSIFPEKFVFENSKYRTTNLNQAILLYRHIDKGLRKKNRTTQ